MIDFFDKLRLWGTDRNPVLQKLRFYSLWNQLVYIIANLILPVYFKATASNKKYRLDGNSSCDKEVIVSLTSFGPRLKKIWLVIEGLLRQKVKPNRMVLYLTESQVPDIEKLPKSLLKLRDRGLEIRLCPHNIRSHTKYWPAMTENPEAIVITVDDDLFYRSDLVANLLRDHDEYPDNICANWVKEIVPGCDKYGEWPDGTKRVSKKNHLLLGVSGVLYPPHALHPHAFNVDNITNLSLTADDVWLSAMAIKQGTPILFTNNEYNHLPVYIPNNTTLISVNRERNQMQVDNIDKYYLEREGTQPFLDLK